MTLPTDWIDFFHMGGYALYVWTSYGLMALVLLVNVLVPIVRKRTVFRALSKIPPREVKRS